MPVPESQKRPPAAPLGSTTPTRSSRFIALAVRLALDVLLVEAAVETWVGGGTLRVGMAAAVGLYLALSIYVIASGGRIGGRGWLMQPLAPAVLFAALLVASTYVPGALATGVMILRQPTSAAMTGFTVALVVAACARLVGPGGARSWWLRVPLALTCAYAAAGFVLGHRAGQPFLAQVNDVGFWSALPRWLQGTWIGAWVVLPLAAARELGAMIARLKVAPYLAWLLLFGLGWWLMVNVASGQGAALPLPTLS
jgi:hypothetical protein